MRAHAIRAFSEPLKHSASESPRRPPARRNVTAKHDFEILTASTLQTMTQEHTRPCNLAPSPLDSIDPCLYVRFPRFSTATEIGHPDLSAEEVISTRYSVDEEGIMQTCENRNSPPKGQGRLQKFPSSLHKAVSSSSLGIKNVGLRLKRAPSSFLPKRAPRRGASAVDPEHAQHTIPETVKANATRTLDSPVRAHKLLEEALLLDWLYLSGTDCAQADSVPNPRYSGTELVNTLSVLEETELSANNHSGLSGLATCSGAERHINARKPGPSEPITPGGVRSSAAADPFQTLQGQFPRSRPAFLGRVCSRGNEDNLTRAISLGSIDELRSNSFISSQKRVYSIPTIPSRRSSLVGNTGTSSPLPSTRPMTVCDLQHIRKLSELRVDPMYIDLEDGHQVDFLFPLSTEVLHGSTPPRPPPNSKADSYRSLRQNPSAPLLVRGSPLKQKEQKVPLFVPSMIIKPITDKSFNPDSLALLSTPNLALCIGDAAEDVQPNRRLNRSKEVLSEASDWSTTVQFGASNSVIDVAHLRTVEVVTPVQQGCSSNVNTDAGVMRLDVSNAADVERDDMSSEMQGVQDKGSHRARNLYNYVADRVRKALSSRSDV